LGTLTSRSLGTLLDNKAVTDVKAKGMEVTGLSSAEIAEFQKIATPACIKWMKTQMEPQWIDDLLKAIEDAEKKLGYR
jgi:TRAP-type C4-dicarboxylate transport system substrate-binding protein